MIETQASGAQMTPEQKLLVRQKSAYAIKTGKLVREPCEVCGAEKTEGHHDDYSKPLAVRWLCKRCHGRVHRGPKGGASQPRHKTHCKHGHPMVGDNIYQTKDGRRCRECYRIRDARRSTKEGSSK